MSSPEIQIGKYMVARLIEAKPKTDVYAVLSAHHGDKLGIIKWFGPWRQYCYFSMDVAVFSAGCFRDLSMFLILLNVEHKKKVESKSEVDLK